MHAIPVGYIHFRVTADGRVADYHASEGMRAHLPAGEVVGWHVSDLVSPGAAPAIMGAIEECLARQTVIELDYVSSRVPGAERLREARFTPIGNDEVLASICDVTERRAADALQVHLAAETKVAQAELRISEERFRALVAEGSDIILIVTAQGLITYASSALERLLGYPDQSLVGTLAFDLVHPDDLEAALAAFALAITGHVPPTRLQYRIRHADGSWRWAESHTTNHLDTPGVEGFMVNVRDISDRHDASVKLKQASDLLASVMGAAGTEAIIVTDTSGMIVAFSRGAEILLGYTAAEVLGLVNPVVFHVREHVAAMAAERGMTPEEMFATGPPDGQSMEHEWVFVRRDGSRFDGLLNVTGRLDSNGNRCGFVAVARDVTEHRRNQAELRRRADYDHLTGLANRSYLRGALNEAAGDRAWSTPGRIVLFIDLDHFKAVNDTYGHAVGDEVLADVADRLRLNLRFADLAARIGGDEFVVLFGTSISPEAAAEVAERIVLTLGRPFVINGTEVAIGASVGLATSYADMSPDRLLFAADRAAYSAKDAGRGRVVAAAR